MMKILIIGGTGLISTAMTREFLARGDSVTLFNRGKTPQRFPSGAKSILGDRNDFSAFEQQVIEAGPFDCVIDMICFTPEQAESDIRAFQGRTAHLIFCSTVNVYTKPAHVYPVKEDFPRFPIDDDYGTKKVLCEDLFMQAHTRRDMAISILRPGPTYGEGGVIIHSAGWSTTYLDRIRKGKAIIVHGDGTSLWDPCHVDDVGHAFVSAACNPTAFGNAYNTTGEELITWNQYHQKVAEALGAPTPKLVHIPTDLLVRLSKRRYWISYNNFQGNNVFDNQAAMRDIDFRYTVAWLDGVRRTVAWLDANNRILNSDDDPFDDQLIGVWEKYATMMVNVAAEKDQ